MKEHYYLINSTIKYKDRKYKKTYYATITKTKKEDTVIIGGVTIKCVVITVDNKNNIAILQTVQHCTECSFFDKLKKGVETINMIQSALKMIIAMYPNISEIEFADNSFIQCNNGKRISLPEFYYIKYGKTWYEKHFNTTLNSKYPKYINAKQLVDDSASNKINLSKNEFMEKYYNNLSGNKLGLIEKCYKPGVSVKEFIISISNNNIDCKYYQDVFEKNILTILHGSQWIISKETIELYPTKSTILEMEKINKHNDLVQLKENIDKIIKNEEIMKGGYLFDGNINE
jgi:hypothetical protein